MARGAETGSAGSSLTSTRSATSRSSCTTRDADLVPTFAAEAHKRGMGLSGHIPRGLSVPGRGGARTQRNESRGISVFDVLSGFSLRPDDAGVLARRDDGGSEHRRRWRGHDGTDRCPRRATTPVIDGTFSGVGARAPGPGSRGPSAPDNRPTRRRATRKYMRLIRRLYDAGGGWCRAPTTRPGAATRRRSRSIEKRGHSRPDGAADGDDHFGARDEGRSRENSGVSPSARSRTSSIVNGKPAEHVSDLEESSNRITKKRYRRQEPASGGAGLVRR